jgi:uncharacterized ferritin-like protein (DUF455 family)
MPACATTSGLATVGALPWYAAEKTAGDVLAHMALLPRVLEARGRDLTPGMIKRSHRTGAFVSRITISLGDEIYSVLKEMAARRRRSIASIIEESPRLRGS